MGRSMLAGVLMCWMGPALGQSTAEPAASLQLLLGSALELGGDKVAEIFFTNGESQFVRAAQGITVFAGGQLKFRDLNQLVLRGSVGIKYVTTAADNAHIRLTRIPVAASAGWMVTPDIRLSAGVVTHQSIRFRADGVGEDLDFQPAAGPVFEVAWKGVGFSFTPMNYTDEFGDTYSARAFGLTLSGVVRLKKQPVMMDVPAN
ncbi:MAG: hypothetical protein NW241_02270 [Bacteroidia bacterium]|nr:hypothetical protein [Bacteroidia bacterium]